MVKRKGGPPTITLDKAQVLTLYLDSGLSATKIGNRLGVSYITIVRRLNSWNIPIRDTYPAWNKGLAADTDERVKKYTEKATRFAGHRHSRTARARMSHSQRGNNTWSKGSKKSTETRCKNSIASKRMWQKPGFRTRAINELKTRWADPLYAARTRHNMLKGCRRRPTLPEQKLIDLIARNNLPFKYTGDGSVILSNLNPDFINSNGAKVVIEVFGDYWHSDKKVRSWKTTELGRMMAYNSLGFRCVVIWEHELNNLPDSTILARLR